MERLRKRATLVALVVLAFASACTTTEITSTWKSPQPRPPVRKALVVAVMPDEDLRDTTENRLATELEKDGIETVLARNVIPNARDLNRDTVRSIAVAEGVDTVVVARFEGVESKQQYEPPVGWNPWNAQNAWYQSTPPLELHRYVRLRTSAYDPAQGTQEWSSTSETLEPSHAEGAVKALASRVVDRMAEDGLI